MSGRAVITFLFVTTLLCVPLVFYQSGFSSERDPAITSECLDCHDDLEPGLAGTSHQINAEGKGVAVGCTDCHFNYEEHLDDPDVLEGVTLVGLNLREQSQICSQCHFGPHQEGMLQLSVHDNCTTCHKVHDNPHPGLLHEKDELDLCLQCHESVRGDFVLPFRHPVNDGVMKCSDCHLKLYADPAADTVSSYLAVSYVDAMHGQCISCHQERADKDSTKVASTQCANCHTGSAGPRIPI